MHGRAFLDSILLYLEVGSAIASFLLRSPANSPLSSSLVERTAFLLLVCLFANAQPSRRTVFDVPVDPSSFFAEGHSL